MERDESPIACVLGALSPEQRARRQSLAATLRASTRGLRQTDDGVELTLKDDAAVWMAAAEFVTLERECCPFLEFTLVSEREHRRTTLTLSGRDGVKEFLRAELGLD